MSLIETKGVALPKPNYEYITKEEDARRALNDIYRYNESSVDTECTSLDPFIAKMTLLQIGTPDKVYVFDVRSDTDYSDVSLNLFKDYLTDKSKTKLLQNAVFDMKLIKHSAGFYVENIYDTMLSEQLFNLGKGFVSASLASLVFRYLGIKMPKEPANTFSDYGQKFKPFQLEYAANDVVVLPMLKELQRIKTISEGLEDAARLEFEFTKPMCEMELNGITMDVDKWRVIMGDIEKIQMSLHQEISSMLSDSSDQIFMFDVPAVNIDSPAQLKSALAKYGLPNIDSTDEATLNKFQGMPIIDALLRYRKANKLISTYGEALLEKINELTGRLHTEFRQMVSTGRMSSANPNLQNIPKKQMYRTCFIAKDGYSLVTADMSGAELRILGNLSQDPVFIECYANGIDLHTRTASEVFDVAMDNVTKGMRNGAKSVNFGLCTPASVKAITNSGIKSIKNVKVGDVVVHDIGSNEVIDSAYMGEKEVFEIKTQYGYILEATADHPIKVINKEGNYVDKELKAIIKDEDKLCLKLGSNVFPKTDYKFEQFEVERITNYKHFDLPVKINKDWASFLGLFVAEGSVFRSKGREKYGTVSFGFSIKDVQLIEKVDKLFNKLFGNRISRITTTKAIRYSINSVIFAEWLVDVLNIKNINKTDEIDIPTCIKNSSKKIQEAFLSWLFEGDGTIKKNGLSYVIKYSSKSKPLMKDLQIMLLNMGILVSLREESREDYPGESYYELGFVGKESKQLFIDNIGFVTARKNNKAHTEVRYNTSYYFIGSHRERLVNIIKNNNVSKQLTDRFNGKRYNDSIGNIYFKELANYDDFFNFIHTNNIVTLPIVSIKSKGIKKVYDISVDKHQYFLANGFVVHNCYGLSKYGLARRLKIPENKADKMIKTYFQKYPGIKRFLDKSAKDAVMNRFSRSVSGRKRYYKLPEYGDPEFRRAKASVERQAKNAPIQGSNADTIKQAMIYLVDRLEKSGYDAKLILTVHDEVVVESKHEERHAVGEIVAKSLVDGFGHYFHLIPMETDALIGPCWLKGECEECKSDEMVFVPDKKYKTKLVCKSCGGDI